MVDFKKLLEEDAKKTPEERHRESKQQIEEGMERYLKEQTERFAEWVKRYPLEIDFEKYTLTITSRIEDWDQFYSEAQNYGFRYIGGKRLVRAFGEFCDNDNLILRLYKLRNRGD